MFQDHAITIVPATETDVDDWIIMRAQLWPNPSDDVWREVQYLLSVENFACFIVRNAQGQALGFMELALRPYVNGCLSSPVAFVEGIWVEERWHRLGIGRRLIDQAEQWGKARGARELASDTRIDSVAAIHAHRVWGFVETERVVYFKKDLSSS